MKRYLMFFVAFCLSSAYSQTLLYDDEGRPLIYAVSGMGNGAPFSDSLYQKYLENGKNHKALQTQARLSTQNTVTNIEVVETSPNPFTNEVSLDFESGKNEVWSIRLLDMMGMEIYKGVIYANTSVMNLPEIKTGLYTLFLKSNMGKVYTQKMMRE